MAFKRGYDDSDLVFAGWEHDVPRTIDEVAGKPRPQTKQMEGQFDYLTEENPDVGQDNLQEMRETASPGSRLNFNIGTVGRTFTMKGDLRLFGAGLAARVLTD